MLNKKGVEALPLRYIIIALVAALVIGIALQFVGTLKGGVINSAEQMNDTLTEKTTQALDDEDPVVSWNAANISCSAVGDELNVSVEVTDASGLEWVYVELKNSTGSYQGLAELTEENGVWSANIEDFTDENDVIKTHDIAGSDTIVIWAKDKADTSNYAVEETITCN